MSIAVSMGIDGTGQMIDDDDKYVPVVIIGVKTVSVWYDDSDNEHVYDSEEINDEPSTVTLTDDDDDGDAPIIEVET